MKFTWTVTNECELNVTNLGEYVNERITDAFERDGQYPCENTIRTFIEYELYEALEGEGYTTEEVPDNLYTKMCEEVLKHVCYQTIMDLGEE